MTTETTRNDGRTDDKTTDTLARLTAFQRDTLWCIHHAGGADYGLGIKGALETYRGEEINHGRLYPNLDTLKDRGLIEKSALDKRTNQYKLTQKAKDLLAERVEWQTDARGR